MSGKFEDRIKTLKRVKASDLVANTKNWRQHPKAQRSAMDAALGEIGFADALLVRETDQGLEIIDGHLRADIADDQKVPVLILDVTAEEADKLLATFDPLAAMAECNVEAFGALTNVIEFKAPELSALVAGVLSDSGQSIDVVQDIAPDPPDTPITKQGDLWRLGKHRLMCGDSGSETDLERLLGGVAIHLVNTDPPYNVNVEPRSNNARAAGSKALPAVARNKAHLQGFDDARGGKPKPTTSKLRAKDRVLANDFMSDEEFEKVLMAWFGNIARALVPGGCFYIWGGYANWANYCSAMASVKLRFAQGITWVKDHPVLGRKDFMNDAEFAWYGWREGAGHKFYGPNNARNVWHVKKVHPQAMVHLTEKPVELAARAIQYSSQPGENVLDLFGGSGSTLAACEQMDRRAYLMEIDPAYCDVILHRYMNLTGKSPVRESDDVKFVAMAVAKALPA